MPSYEDTARENMIKEFKAMETPDTWFAHQKEKINSVLGKLDMERCEKMADHLNNRFMDAAMACDAPKLEAKWKDLNNTEKLEFTQRLVDTLIQLLNSDIQNNRVTLYNNDGSVYIPTNAHFDSIFKEEIDDYMQRILKIKVTPADDGMMGLASNGKLHLNIDFPFYKLMLFFLMDLRHEMMHMIDIFIPQISALSPDVRAIALRYYISPENKDKNFELYEKNPLEVNANLKRREFRLLCTTKFDEWKKKTEQNTIQQIAKNNFNAY